MVKMIDLAVLHLSRGDGVIGGDAFGFFAAGNRFAQLLLQPCDAVADFNTGGPVDSNHSVTCIGSGTLCSFDKRRGAVAQGRKVEFVGGRYGHGGSGGAEKLPPHTRPHGSTTSGARSLFCRGA